MALCAVLEAPAFVAGLDDLAVVRKPVEQRGCHLGISEDAGPFAEGQVGCDNDGCAFVEFADQVEQELSAGLGEGQVAELVEDQEVEAGDEIGGSSLAFCAGFCVQLVHQVDHIEEPTPAAFPDACPGDADGKMGFAGACASDQDEVALMVEEVAVGQVADQGLVNLGGLEVELLQFLGERHSAMVIWYLTDRACFSLISAVSRSPMICCGSFWRLTAVVRTSS